VAVVIKRFEVFLVGLDPTVGSEIQKTRPCLIISPDEMNQHIRTVIIAPITSAGKDYPSRVRCTVQKRPGHIVLDQIRTIEKTRLIRRLATIDRPTQTAVVNVLQQMFAW
jgi:mRNA interferase MazF